jgi:hypothetical protein
MNTETFKEKYLDKKFDEILINNSNVLLNSNEHYIQFKKKYKDETMQNYTLFCNLHSQLLTTESFTITHTTSYIDNYINKDIDSKKIYLYTDSNKQISIQQEINYLLHKQQQLYDNFTHYLDKLNIHSNEISQKTKHKPKSITDQINKQHTGKNKFVKFFDKNKT